GAAVRLARRRHRDDSGAAVLSARGGGVYAGFGGGAFNSPSRRVSPNRFSSASTATCSAVRSLGPRVAPQRTHTTTGNTLGVVTAPARGDCGTDSTPLQRRHSILSTRVFKNGAVAAATPCCARASSRVADPTLIDLNALLNKDRKSTRLNSSHLVISYAVFCLKKKTTRSSWTRGWCASST